MKLNIITEWENGEPRIHLSSKDSKLKKLAQVFALKKSAFRIANVRGKTYNTILKYIVP